MLTFLGMKSDIVDYTVHFVLYSFYKGIIFHVLQAWDSHSTQQYTIEMYFNVKYIPGQPRGLLQIQMFFSCMSL